MTALEEQLHQREISPTALRLLILRAMLDSQQAFSLSDLESSLDTVDRSTISRTITLFHKKLLIHSIDDGSGSMKYAVCRNDCKCALNDLHVHFWCSHCKKTFCLNTITIPEVALPPKFVLQSVNFVFKGLCSHCAQFAT